jgi:hypothetical protein
MKEHIETVRPIHGLNLKDGYGGLDLPHALTGKFPNAWESCLAIRFPRFRSFCGCHF